MKRIITIFCGIILSVLVAGCGKEKVMELPGEQETLELRAGCFRVEGTVQAEEDIYGIREYILWEKPQLKPEESILYPGVMASCTGSKFYRMMGILDEEKTIRWVLEEVDVESDEKESKTLSNEEVMQGKDSEIGMVYDSPKQIVTEQGEILFPVINEEKNETEIQMLDHQNHNLVLGTITDDFVLQLLGMHKNVLYYENLNGIVAWNVTDGKRTMALSFRENGIDQTFERRMVVKEDGMPVLLLFNQDKTWIAPLCEKQLARENQITIADLVNDYSGRRMLTEWAVAVGKEDRNIRLTYEGAKGDPETYKQKIFAELAADEGPDLLYVSRADFLNLQRNGVAAELTDMIDRSILSDVWPAVIELGTVDEKLYGMPGSLMAVSIALPKGIREQESWTLEDMVALMECGKLQNTLYYPAVGTNFAPLAVTRSLTERTNWLIDWENGECHFKDSIYPRMLRALGFETVPKGEEDSAFGKGNRMVFVDLSDDDFEYYNEVLLQGELIGFPTEEGIGNYMDTRGILVVNARSKNMEQVKRFLASFWDDSVQSDGISPYRYNDSEATRTEEGEFVWREHKLESLPDGKTTLHVMIDFLNSCRPAPMMADEIDAILYEELDAMYQEKKKPEDVVDIINSRVQLYLDER